MFKSASEPPRTLESDLADSISVCLPVDRHFTNTMIQLEPEGADTQTWPSHSQRRAQS